MPKYEFINECLEICSQGNVPSILLIIEISCPVPYDVYKTYRDLNDIGESLSKQPAVVIKRNPNTFTYAQKEELASEV
jgi:hypothetical protein